MKALIKGRVAAKYVLTAAGILAAFTAQAQMPNIDQTFLNEPSNLERDVIRFCVYPRSATAQIDRAVAQAIGDSLLLPTEIVEIDPAIRVEGIDTIPISLEDLYLLFENECNAFMGIDLASGVYPDWLILTRAYLRAPYVPVAREGTIESFDLLEAGDAVATQSMSLGDSRLGLYLRALPQDQRLRRVPYPTVDLQLERLIDGTVDVALVWQPWLARDDIALGGIEQIGLGDMDFGARHIAIGLHVNDRYLRQTLDSAIEAITDDGTITRVIEPVAASTAS